MDPQRLESFERCIPDEELAGAVAGDLGREETRRILGQKAVVLGATFAVIAAALAVALFAIGEMAF